jgi:hypothetical protein
LALVHLYYFGTQVDGDLILLWASSVTRVLERKSSRSQIALKCIPWSETQFYLPVESILSNFNSSFEFHPTMTPYRKSDLWKALWTTTLSQIFISGTTLHPNVRNLISGQRNRSSFSTAVTQLFLHSVSLWKDFMVANSKYSRQRKKEFMLPMAICSINKYCLFWGWTGRKEPYLETLKIDTEEKVKEKTANLVLIFQKTLYLS